MGIGIPGSGKTTVLKEFAKKWGYSYVCPDDIRLEMTGSASDQSKNNEVWNEVYIRVENELRSGNSVILDATFANPKQRKQFIEFVREKGAEKVQGVFLDTPVETAKERNKMRERVVPEHAMDRMIENIKKFPPEIKEGLDGLFTLNELGSLAKAEINLQNKTVDREFRRIA